MSVTDKGRRRRRLDDEGEDEDAEKSPVTRPSECESEGEGADVDLSEYESAVDESADPQNETEEGSESETEDGSESEEETGSETETEGGEGYTDDEGLEEERQSGDGEEQPDNDKPDDDEDKKNPAYVPRKGAFYEHDFRQGEEEPEKEEGDDSKPKKKLWQDEGKWGHDRYIDEMQAPKSTEELIAIYGYDIRAADKPPEAPPRRPRRNKGPRGQRFQDFMPRMAVIDTTEDGSDSVPNLGDDELVLYSESTSRYNRRNNMRNSDARRGGRGSGRGGGGNYRANDVDNQNYRNRSDYNMRAGEGRNNQDSRREIISQDVRTNEEFPSLEESTRQTGPRDNRGGNKYENSDRVRIDSRPSDRSQRTYQTDNRDNNRRGEYRDDGNRRGEYRDNNRSSYQYSQDSRRQEGNNRYQQGYREERRGGYNNNRPNARSGNYNGRAQEENWRSAPSDVRDGYTREEYGRNSQEFGYNKRSQQQQSAGGDNRGPGAGNSGDAGGYSSSNKRNNRGFDQPPRYQQQQQAPEEVSAATREPREYTNSSYKMADDKSSQKAVTNAGGGPVNVSDSGDGNVSSSKNVVISNKENVQTINVTITSTTTEKKSYAKERRAKGTRPGESAAILSNPSPQPAAVSGSTGPYQGLPPGGIKMEQNTPPPTSGAKRYSSQRQQGLGKGGFTEPPPVDARGANLYNPALPPPPFFQGDHATVAPNQHSSNPAPGSVQDPSHFTPALLPPAAATALPFGLAGVPVSSTGLALPPAAAGIPANPALFQPPTGPPPPASIPAAGTALMAPPYLPAGMVYGGAPRVPPPGTPAGFPLPMAYTSPPPPATAAATVVGSQPPPRGTSPQQGSQSTAQHKKVYRGDITYYAPELQQPSRTPQRRPKAAIPIIDPQEEHKRQKQKEKSDHRSTPDKSTVSSGKQTSPPAGKGKHEAPATSSQLPTSTGLSTGKSKLEVSTSTAGIGQDLSSQSAGHVTTSPASDQVAISSSGKDVPLDDLRSGSGRGSEQAVAALSVTTGHSSDGSRAKSKDQDIPSLSVATQSFKSDVVTAETIVSEQSSLSKALPLHTDKQDLTVGVTENSSSVSVTQVQSAVENTVKS